MFSREVRYQLLATLSGQFDDGYKQKLRFKNVF